MPVHFLPIKTTNPAETLIWQLKTLDKNTPTPTMEHRFSREIVGNEPGVRKRLNHNNLKDWRFDIAFTKIKIAVEIEGGAWNNGRHVRGKGFHNDLIKYSHAMANGWTVYRCDNSMIQSGIAAQHIQLIIQNLTKYTK